MDVLRNKIAGANARLRLLLAETRQTLRGERDFGPSEVQSLREPLTEMDPVMARAKEWRLLHPELAEDLDLYKSQLADLQDTLEKVRIMLLVRRASLCANHVQITAVNHWAKTLEQTR